MAGGGARGGSDPLVPGGGGCDGRKAAAVVAVGVKFGEKPRQVTGVGIMCAFLPRWDQSEYRFRFVRVDDSEAHVILTEQRWGGAAALPSESCKWFAAVGGQ